jgi:hypothetical protein
MLRDQIIQQVSKRLASLPLREGASDITRYRIRSPGTNLPVYLGNLLLRQGDGNL